MSNINTPLLPARGRPAVRDVLPDAAPEDGRVVYSNAGHNPPLWMRGGTERVLLERGGMMFGVMEGAPFRRRR